MQLRNWNLESCVNRSIDDSIRVLHVVEQIRSTLVHRYTRLITAASYSPVSMHALLSIHARAMVLGVSTNLAFPTSLLASVAPASLTYACRVFDAVPVHVAYMWNTLLRAHAHSQSSYHADTLALYKRMRAAGVAPDHYTYPIRHHYTYPIRGSDRPLMVTQCGSRSLGMGLCTALSSRCTSRKGGGGRIADAELVFAESHGSSQTVVSWTAMVAGYMQNYFFGEAVALFGSVIAEGFLMNEITPISFLPCLQGQEWLDAGEMVHGFMIRLGFDANIPLAKVLIAMYGKCGSIPMAQTLFEGISARNLASWNTMVARYEQHGDVVEAIKFFRRMFTEKVRFECVTLVSVLSACAC